MTRKAKGRQPWQVVSRVWGGRVKAENVVARFETRGEALAHAKTQNQTVEKRTTLRDPADWLLEWFGGTRTVSGERVNEETAMGLSAWFGAIRAISEDVAKLDLIIYNRLPNGGKERATAHPLFSILHDSPNPDMSSMTFRETILQHALGWGNGYAEIVSNNGGRVSALWIIDPSSVIVKREPNLFYEVQPPDSGKVIIPADRMFHIHGLGPDGFTGYNLTRLAREAVGAAIAAQKFGAAFFGNGASAGSVLEHPSKLSDTALTNLRRSWQSRHGGAGKAMGLAILEEGMKYQQYGVPPENAQFIETQQFNVEDVARWFRIPPHKIQHLLRATFANIEHQAIEYVGDTLLPWMKRYEQEVDRKLLGGDRQFFAEHLVDSLLRADTKSRNESHKIAIESGWKSRNEVRIEENKNPLPGLDVMLVPLNFGPADQLGKKPKAVPPSEPPEPPETDEEEARAICDRIAGVQRPLLEERLQSVLRVESDKIERARKRGGFSDWCDKFFKDHATYVRGALIPAVDTYCATVWEIVRGGEMPESALMAIAAHTSGMAARHVEAVQLQIDDADGLGEMNGEAKCEMKHLAAMMTKELTA